MSTPVWSSNRLLLLLTLAASPFSLTGQERREPRPAPRVCRENTLHLRGVAFLAPNTAIAVGDDGVLRSTDAGASWQTVPIATSRRLTAIGRLPVQGHGAVVGLLDSVLLTSDGGATWASRPTGTTFEELLAVSFGDARTGTAVGRTIILPPDRSDGTVLRTTDGGATWTKPPGVLPNALTDVFFTSVDTGVAVGGSGTILRTVNGGTAWTRQVSGTSGFLGGVVFTDPEIGFAVGENGTILHTTDGGVTWAIRASGTTRTLHAVAFANRHLGIAVGDSGAILRTTDGGATWSVLPSGIPSPLYALAFADSLIGVAVGGDRAILRTTDGGATWILVSGRTAVAAALGWRLVEASERGRPDEVVALLRAGASPDATDREGDKSALAAAAARGDTAIVRILLDAGAAVDRRGRGETFTVLTRAAAVGHTRTVQLILERGACRDGTALAEAAWFGHDEIVRLLLARGDDVNSTGITGSSALVGALISYPRRTTHVAVVRALLEAGAPVNRRDRGGQTPLMLAVGAGAAAEARVLIEHGADIAADIAYARANGAEDLARRLERLSRTSIRTPPPRPATPADSLTVLEELLRRAEADWEDVLGDQPPPGEAWAVEDVERARASLAARISAHPDDARAQVLWARAARLHGSLADSYVALDRALALEPRNPEAHYWTGRLRGEPGITEDSLGTQRQNLENAVGHLRTAVELAPQNVAYRRTLAAYLVDQGRPGEARTVMSTVAGGRDLILQLLSDLQAVPIPDGTLLRAGPDFYIYSVGSLEALGRTGRIEHPRLRLRVHRLAMNAEAVEAFYRRHWPAFRFVPMEMEEEEANGSRVYLQHLRRTGSGFEPLTGAARVPGQPTDGISMMLVDEGAHPEGSGTARSYLVLLNHRR